MTTKYNEKRVLLVLVCGDKGKYKMKTMKDEEREKEMTTRE